MARQHDRGRAVRFAAQVIRANQLSDDELELQLDSLWKSGYQQGRKVAIKEDLVDRGVRSLRRMREEALTQSESEDSEFQSADEFADHKLKRPQPWKPALLGHNDE